MTWTDFFNAPVPLWAYLIPCAALILLTFALTKARDKNAQLRKRWTRTMRLVNHNNPLLCHKILKQEGLDK